MKKKLSVFLLASVMTIGLASAAFAAEDDIQTEDYNSEEITEEVTQIENYAFEETAENVYEESHYYTFSELYANFQSDRELYYGLQGDDVASLQRKLADLGFYSANIDGDFGNYTYSSVIAFQNAAGLYADGVVGSITANALNAGGTTSSGNSGSTQDEPSLVTLSMGSVGSAVTQLQQRLTELGFYTASIDGDFGYYTYSSVVAFQNANGLVADGIVGALTNAVLYESSNPAPPAVDTPSKAGITIGMTGEAVLSLQAKLYSIGFLDSDIDGIFGNYTKAAVVAFQKAYGLTADGIADEATLSKLESLTANSDVNNSDTVNESTVLRYGSESADVYTLQNILMNLGFLETEPTGYFGSLTEAAVISFQTAYGLYPDGVAGPLTLSKLNSVYLSGGSVQPPSGSDLPGNSISGINSIQRSIINAAYSTPTTPLGYCSAWISEVMGNAGVYFNAYANRPSEYSYAVDAGLVDEWYEGDTSFNANDYWAYVCYSSDFSVLEPGMIIATRNSFSYLGQQFGHVGIYVGNDTVLSSVGYIEEISLSEWILRYNNTALGSTVKWGAVY